ncbi:unnamed protein product [Calypogeia fissa]
MSPATSMNMYMSMNIITMSRGEDYESTSNRFQRGRNKGDGTRDRIDRSTDTNVKRSGWDEMVQKGSNSDQHNAEQGRAEGVVSQGWAGSLAGSSMVLAIQSRAAPITNARRFFKLARQGSPTAAPMAEPGSNARRAKGVFFNIFLN